MPHALHLLFHLLIPIRSSLFSSPSGRYGRGGAFSFDGLQLAQPPPGAMLRSPLGSDGLVADWDALEALLAHVVAERLPSAGAGGAAATDLSGHPVVLSEHLFASKADRERWCTLLFERFRVPGVFIAKAGVLALYANARTSGIAVDMGAGGTQITPVQEGYPLMMGARVHPVGGRLLDAELAAVLAARGIALTPRVALAGRPLHGSVLSWHASELARDVKESTCRVQDAALDAGTLQKQLAAACTGGDGGAGAGGAGAAAADLGGSAFSPANYTLPDGNVVVVGRERVLVPEMLFSSGVKTATGMTLQQSLHDTLLACSMGCEMDARRDLVGNMVVTGGNSRLPGLYERLIREFLPIAPPGTRARFVAGSGEERSLGPWLGGSILGSLGTFHDMWFSAAEYSEHGVKYVHRKCP